MTVARIYWGVILAMSHVHAINELGGEYDPEAVESQPELLWKRDDENKVEVVDVDFEFHTDFSGVQDCWEQGSIGQDGGRHYVVGIEVGKLSVRYSGCCALPNPNIVRDEIKFTLSAYLAKQKGGEGLVPTLLMYQQSDR